MYCIGAPRLLIPGIIPIMHVLTRLHIIVYACMSKKSHFDNVGKVFASCFKFIQFAHVCLFSVRLNPQHSSVAPHFSSFTSYFIIYSVCNDWSCKHFHQSHIGFFSRIPLYFLIVFSSMVAFAALPIPALMYSKKVPDSFLMDEIYMSLPWLSFPHQRQYIYICIFASYYHQFGFSGMQF